MHRFQHLLVAMTCTEADSAPVESAARIARLGSVRETRFVHVLDPRPREKTVLTHDQAVTAMEEAVKAHFQTVPDAVHVDLDVVKGPVIDRLLTFAAEQESDLLVVGAHRHARAARLAMMAPCSILAVPVGSPASYRRILVSVDFSEHSVDSLKVAISLASLSGGGEVIALHVDDDDPAIYVNEKGEQEIAAQKEQAFERFLLETDTKGIPVRPVIEPVKPWVEMARPGLSFANAIEGADVAGVILDTAKRLEADLIVMGTRGRSRSASILLGSVTDKAIQHAEVPLLAVKHFGGRLGLLEVLLDRSFGRRRGPNYN